MDEETTGQHIKRELTILAKKVGALALGTGIMVGATFTVLFAVASIHARVDPEWKEWQDWLDEKHIAELHASCAVDPEFMAESE